jgi:hypothetical protein
LGYNVFLFAEFKNEDVNDQGRGVALDEIEREIRDRGVRFVSFVGYSHGASACYHISQRLVEDIPVANVYTIPLAAYIDPVQRTGAGDFATEWLHASPETNTPAAMGVGITFWEPNGTAGVKGGPVPTMANVPVTAADDGKKINHINIDDQPSVWDGIEASMLSAMPPS